MLVASRSAVESAVNRDEDDIRNWDLLREDLAGLSITTETRGRQPLVLNEEQEDILPVILNEWENGRPAFIIGLKSRRMGFSTLIEGISYVRCRRFPHRRAQVAAHDSPGSDVLFNMTKQFQDYCSPEWKKLRKLRYNTKKTLHWHVPHSSIMSVGHGNNTNLASGDMVQYLHLSELAKWEDPVDPYTSIMQCVPKRHWEVLVVIESTAKGAHNLFHQKWMQAVAGKNRYIPIFLSWIQYPEKYSLDPTGFVFDAEERKFQQEHNLTDAQLAWVQDTRLNYCNGNWALFHQEYPATPELAFQFSGRPWFLPEAIERARIELIEPKKRVKLEFIGERTTAVAPKDDPTGRIVIWEDPIPGRIYVAGMDVGEGVGASNTVLPILKLGKFVSDPSEQVAKFRSNRTRAQDAGIEAFKLCMYYNCALLGVERNNHGHATLGVLKEGHVMFPQMLHGYPQLYHYVVPGRAKDEVSRVLGWRTDGTSRPKMLNHIEATFNGGRTIVRCRHTLFEMEGFGYDIEREIWIQKAIDPLTELPLDDEIFAYAIALQMAEHYFTHRAMPRAKDGTF